MIVAIHGEIFASIPLIYEYHVTFGFELSFQEYLYGELWFVKHGMDL